MSSKMLRICNINYMKFVHRVNPNPINQYAFKARTFFRFTIFSVQIKLSNLKKSFAKYTDPIFWQKWLDRDLTYPF